jgi:O-antigen ligase
MGKLLSRLGWLLLLAIVYAGLLLGAAQALSRVDERMKSMFDLTALRQDGFLAYANQLVFAERIVFWQLGWDVFNDHPWLGVGLGNTGYSFLEKMNSFGWALPEVNHIAFQEEGVPNSKSLWTRLLAETGLAGFGLFLAWLAVIFLTGRSLGRSPDRLGATLGLAAQLGLAALILEGFSVDTFALPYFWILFGLATAAWMRARRAAISKTAEMA